MTVTEIQVLRDKAYQALLDFDYTKVTHSVDGESYDYDGHLKTLQDALKKWDDLLTVKNNAGLSHRMNMKAI